MESVYTMCWKYLPKAEHRLNQVSSHAENNHPGSQKNPHILNVQKAVVFPDFKKL